MSNKTTEQRLEELLAAVARFRDTRGKHDGPHEYDLAKTGIPCVYCEQAYNRAEAELDRVYLQVMRVEK